MVASPAEHSAPSLKHLRTRVARAVRDEHVHGSEPIVEARRELAAAKLEDYVRRVVDAAPPLTEAQRDRITAILRGGHDAA